MHFKKLFFMFSIMALAAVSAFGQTHPLPYNLNSGSYVLNSWLGTNLAGTYPPNMVFHKTGATVDPTVTTAMASDYARGYAETSYGRIYGDGDNGFSFINSGTNATGPYLGAAVLALNTTGCTNIQIGWTGRTVSIGTGRPYVVRLEYRIDTTAEWLDMPTTSLYAATGTANDFTVMPTVTLPAAAENQAYVEVRWHYYQNAASGSGSRPRIGVDDITVSATVASAPVVTTAAATGTSTTITTGGNVTNGGSATVTARGVCWGTAINPEITGDHTIDGAGTGEFTSTITGLTPNTVYHVRAYATNSVGTSYGDDVTTSTGGAIPPSVLTTQPTATSTTIETGGNVTAIGSSAVTARGVCWGTATEPTIAGNHTTDGAGLGNYFSTITGLTPSTTYYVRAYATSADGTAYGFEYTIATLAPQPPTVTTTAGVPTATTITTGGNVTSEGTTPVTARGVCWGTATGPTVAGNHTTNGSGAGEFTSTITGLNPVTTYFVRAYATSATGTSYGSEITVKTAVAAYDLFASEYNMVYWDSLAPAGNYPPSMIFRCTTAVDPGLASEMNKDWTLAYNLKSGTRINGLLDSGFCFVNTGSSNTGGGWLGTAELSLNTTNCANINVNWVGGFMDLSSSSTRDWRIRLQYKVGTNGTYNDVLDANGQPVEYNFDAYINNNNWASLPRDSKQLSGTLPFDAENQPYVVVRWKFYQKSSIAGGARPRMRIDDINITRQSTVGTPTKLTITAVTPQKPMTGLPFSITVRSTDAAGAPKNVSQATTVTLSKTIGSGNLMGTLTGTIPAGLNYVVFNNLTYETAQNITVRADASLGDVLGYATKQITVLAKPTVALNIYPKGHVGIALPTFTVEAHRTNGEIETNYSNYDATITKISGPGNITGVMAKKTQNGVASFDGLVFSAPGTYVIRANAQLLGDAPDQEIVINAAPTLGEVIIPRFAKGVGNVDEVDENNSTRVPTYALVTINNLHPNTIYKYVTGGQKSGYTGTKATDGGAGNNFHHNHITDTYIYSTFRNTSMTDTTPYSTFMTGAAETSKTIWINLVPTANAIFAEDNQFYWIVTLGNEKGLINRMQTTNLTTSLDFGVGRKNATGIADRKSTLDEKNFVCLYNETATGAQPMTTAIVMENGAELRYNGKSQAAPFYRLLELVPNSWATVIPNGIKIGQDELGQPIYQDVSLKRLEEYSPNGVLLHTWTKDDGIWKGVSTLNLSGGMTAPLYFETPEIALVNPLQQEAQVICNSEPFAITWQSRGISNVKIEASGDNGTTWTTVIASTPAVTYSSGDYSYGSYLWDMPRNTYTDRAVRIRVTPVEHSYISYTSGQLTVFDGAKVESITANQIICHGDNLTLQANVSGSGIGYQWCKDNKEIPGATSSTYSIINADYPESGIYSCKLSSLGPCNVVTSDPVLVYVAGPTRITRQPENQTVTAGSDARFFIETHINGAPPEYVTSYQWYKNGMRISDNEKYIGTQTDVLVVANVTADDEGTFFTCVATGLCGVASSDRGKITLINGGIVVSSQPHDQKTCLGSDISLSAGIEINSTAKPVFQWFKDGTAIADNTIFSGANSRVLTIANIDETANGYYRLSIVNEANGIEILSSSAKVSVQPEIAFSMPGELSLNLGETVIIRADANVDATAFQWYFNGRPIDGANKATFEKPGFNFTDCGAYHCTMSTACGNYTSPAVNVVALYNPTSAGDVSANGYTLEAVSPNPVSTIAAIRYSLPTADQIRIELSDMFGNKVATIKSASEQGTGIAYLNAEALNLTSGVYYVTLKAGKATLTQKISVVR